MYKYIYIIVFLTALCMPEESLAQYGTQPIGGRAGGLGNATVTLQDPWSLFNNVGGLAHVEEHTSIFAYNNRFGLEKGIPSMMAAVVVPFSWGVPGLSFYRFGDQHYSEQHIALSYGHHIGAGSIGIKGNLVQYHIEGSGIRRVLAAEIGGVMELIPSLYMGAHIYNLNQARISTFNEEMVPVTMKTGLSYSPSDKLLLAMGISKTIQYKPSLHTGLEFRVLKFKENGLYLRTGVSTFPLVNAFGVGFKHSLMKIDYALSTRNILGPGHQLSVSTPLKFFNNAR